MMMQDIFGDEWHKKFQMDGRNGVHGYQDEELIYEIMKLLGISHELIGAYNSDSHFYTKKRSDQKIPYKRIRDTADTLGIPPYVIFADNEGNKELVDLIENTEDPLPVYYVNWDEEIKIGSTVAEEDDNLRLLDVSKLIYRFTEILGVIKQALLSENFQFAAHVIFLSEQIETVKMTIRLVKKTRNDLPPSQKKSIVACWSYMTPSEHDVDPHNKREIAKIKTIINHIAISLSNYLKPNGKLEYMFKDGLSKLLSWHSHRTASSMNNVLTNLLQIKEERYQSHNLNQSLFNLHCMQKFPSINKKLKIQNNESLNRDVDFNGLLFQSPIYEGPKNSHLAYLLEFGRIENGIVLVCTLVDNVHYKDLINEDDNSIKAKVVIHGSKILLEWQYDKKLYKLTEINQKIIDYYDLKLSAKRGVDLWRFEDGHRSLKKVVEELKELEGRLRFF